jgi:hypothetical protein
VSDLTPFQMEALRALPRDGSPATIRDDHAFVLAPLTTLARVEQPLRSLQAQGVFAGHPIHQQMARACLLAAGIEIAFPPPPAKAKRRG